MIPERYKGAYSIENRAAHGADTREIKQVDEFVSGRWKYIIYEDEKGEYWYENQIRKGKKFVSMEEAIFGKNMPRKYYKHN